MKAQEGILKRAHDWQLRVVLGKQLKFLENIMETTLRPDTVLASNISKQMILLELILPLEEQMEEASERKRGKICRCAGVVPQSGWRAWCLPI